MRLDAGDAALHAAATANLAVHMRWVQANTPGMRVVEQDGLYLVDSGLACDTFNVVAGAHLDETTAGPAITRVLSHFRAVDRPFAWWVGPSDQPADLGRYLAAAGLRATGSELAMYADLGSLETTDTHPEGLRIRRVSAFEQVRDFARIVAASWTPPDSNVLRFYEAATPALLSDSCPIFLYVGYLGVEPVATAELTLAGGIAGLYNIATVERHRRKGIGSALTLVPLIDAREEGIGMAVLQAAAAGQNLYARLGFRPYGHFTEYTPPTSLD